MTFNQLAITYPDVRFEVTNGQKRLARVTMEYNIVGSPEAIARFLEELDKEWPFAQQRCKRISGNRGLQVQVEYVVKPEEIEEFVKRVPYRGKDVVAL